MRRTVESPDTGTIPPPPDERPSDGHGSGIPSCEELTASPQSDAVEIADTTGAHLIAPMPVSPKRRLTSILGMVAGMVVHDLSRERTPVLRSGR